MPKYFEEQQVKVAFNVDGDGEEVILTYNLIESGAFQYGNQSAVIINDGTPYERYLDTRYEWDVVADFPKWAVEYTNLQCRVGEKGCWLVKD